MTGTQSAQQHGVEATYPGLRGARVRPPVLLANLAALAPPHSASARAPMPPDARPADMVTG